MKKYKSLVKFAKSLEKTFIIYYNIGVFFDKNESLSVLSFKNARKQ